LIVIIMACYSLAQINYWQLTLDGGLTNVFILFLSCIAVATVIERFANLYGDRVVSKGLVETLRRRWKAATPEELDQLCASRDEVFSQVIAFLIRNRDRDYAFLSPAVSDLASMEIRKQMQRVYPLALVATLAPLVGLFGTVLGMVETFHTVAEIGNAGNIGLLASGIYKALSTTAVGLAVAIPALAFNHYFRMRIRAQALLMEKGINEFFNDIIMKRGGHDAHQ
jgi:biopolymer transport protein ExbB